MRPEAVVTTGSRQERIRGTRAGLLFASLLLTLWPVWRMARFLATTGADNHSNDEVYFVGTVQAILQGHYPWSHLFRDSFIAGHLNLFPMLTFAAFGKLFHWSIPVALQVGIGLALVRVGFFYAALSRTLSRPWKVLLLPVLVFLTFSPTQLSSFEFDLIAVNEGLTLLGLAVAVWALVRFPNRWAGVLLSCLGAWLSSWSSAGGAMVWPAVLLGLWGLGFRRRGFYVFWAEMVLVAAVPYVNFFWIHPADQGLWSYQGGWHPAYIAKLAGLPLAQALAPSQAYRRGLVAMLFLGSGFALAWGRTERKVRNLWILPLVLLAFSLLHFIQLAAFRSDLDPAPWYASSAMLFWIALAGLAFAWLDSQAGVPGTRIEWIRTAWSLGLLGTLGYFYGTSNLSFEDKSFYLRSRSPAAASCLRNFEVAPPECFSRIFLWPPRRSSQLQELGEPLRQARLGVFAPRQTWTMQGDAYLGRVAVEEQPGLPKVLWTVAADLAPLPPQDYHRLNLFTHAGNAARWAVKLPAAVRSVDFVSAVAISSQAPVTAPADGMTFRLQVEPKGQAPVVLRELRLEPGRSDWEPFRVSLRRFAGQEIEIKLVAVPGGNLIHDWGLWQYPRLEIRSAW